MHGVGLVMGHGRLVCAFVWSWDGRWGKEEDRKVRSYIGSVALIVEDVWKCGWKVQRCERLLQSSEFGLQRPTLDENQILLFLPTKGKYLGTTDSDE